MGKILLGVVLAALAYLLFWPTALQPVAWQPAPVPALEGIWAPNTRLDSAELEQDHIPGPDTVVEDEQGWRYSGLEDGRIVRWHEGEPAQTFIQLDGRPVGLNFGPDGSLYAADELKGYVWHISADGKQAEKIVQSTAQLKFSFIDDIYIAQDGRVFFTEASSRWNLAQNKQALLEHSGDGAVYVRYPDGRIELVLDKLEFANGVILSPDESYLLVAETGAYRITRLWLTGPRKGQREALLDNLPAFPGDLSIAPDGTYWASFFTPRKALLDKLAPWPFARKVLSRLPQAWLPKPVPYPAVFRFDGNGKVLESLTATPGIDLPSFSSVVQSGDTLLMGTPGGVGEIDAARAYRLRLH
ncbi:SMP-30/gluconolactonase/LRE family protein [Pseudomonas sp. 5P_3.1_Bac2]|uniref:SMP-30/gluconolactonase/LRE family protein n=1 Tax=Pseudomonas sp. 5P_3.1_Bac2 TaxID=2971617 RepID=UPI0021C68C75|nr:SMP-30/gluconolactonase/LRE family protein [Pseudomonas sp. 5P_3.1_Bac2]MCU1717756.1 SMP-30/gluconolactonase/LRE family protein [Pseudomonas sp. 5P_3.1_Bac2]